MACAWRRGRSPPACPAIRRRRASSASSRRTVTTTPTSTVTRRCHTCSASPGRGWRCTKACCRAIRPRTAAFACRMTSPRSCGPSPTSAYASSWLTTSSPRSTSRIRSCSCRSSNRPSPRSRRVEGLTGAMSSAQSRWFRRRLRSREARRSTRRRQPGPNPGRTRPVTASPSR